MYLYVVILGTNSLERERERGLISTVFVFSLRKTPVIHKHINYKEKRITYPPNSTYSLQLKCNGKKYSKSKRVSKKLFMR